MNTLTILRTRANKAWETNDLTTLRQLIIDGGMFASLTIRNRTERAERIFLQWKADGRPTDLTPYHLMTACQTRLDSLLSLSVDNVYTLASLPHHERTPFLVGLTSGFGYSKSAFALACAGLGYDGCVDCRLIQKHRDKLTGHLKGDSLKPGYQHYLSVCNILWPGVEDRAEAQWSEWLADMSTDGRTTQHEVLL